MRTEAGIGGPAAGTAMLAGRTALVTGGANGIGRACALRLARAGAVVTVVDRDEAGVKEVAGLIGGRAIAANLLDLEALDELDLAADILVNNAGFQHVAPVDTFPTRTFDEMVTLMLVVPFRLARICLPTMYDRGWGRVVNISSVHGVRASPYKSAYVAAKHGLEGLSKVIALEGATHGVTSNCVNPAYVRTGLVEQQIAAQAQQHGLAEDDVVSEVMLAPAAIKRLIEPDEVAELVAYLCSAEASFITGASMMMDGGWSAH
jgi:3-hydroxybutyrate dehydrogenase